MNPEEVLRLNPVRFRWKRDGSPDVGLIAEEVDEVLKDLVTYNEKGKPEGVQYEKLSLYLLEVVKDQQKQIEALTRRISSLEGEAADPSR